MSAPWLSSRRLVLDVYVNVKHATTVTVMTKERTQERVWSVRELADQLGVTTRTLRFYEAEGLLSPLRMGTARIYSARDRTRLKLILRGKRFGMSLPEIREIIDMYDHTGSDGAGTGEQAQLTALVARLEEIGADLRARRRDLTRTLKELDDVASRCRARLVELSGPELSGPELSGPELSGPELSGPEPAR
jgi:DNA-binding transcriptional MerR regulator